MKKSHVLSALALIIAMAIPAVASAEKGVKYTDKAGRFGIGADRTLGGVGGLSARFQVAKNFGVQAIVSFARIGLDAKDANDQTQATTSVQQIAGSLRGDIGLAFTNKTALSIIFGVDIFSDSSSLEITGNADNNVETSDTRFAFEAGLKAEYHFTDYFSIHTEVGFVFALVNRASEAAFIASSAGVPLPSGGDTGAVSEDGSVIVFGVPDTFGNAGFTFWFK